MKSKQNIWVQNYQVSTYLVNPQKKLGLYGLLNLIQDTAWIHAGHLGHGYEEMLKEGTFWVLTRQLVMMNEWPLWGEEILLRTWVRPITSMLAVRDFEIIRNGEVIGECTTQWLILDQKTRRPSEKKITMSQDEFYASNKPFRDATKIPLKKDHKEIARFEVRNSDLDLNGHVNNTRYAQWILDAVPREKHLEFKLHEYEVNFLSETHAGDVISICSAPGAEEKFQFQGIRLSDQKIVFAATLKVSAEHFSL